MVAPVSQPCLDSPTTGGTLSFQQSADSSLPHLQSQQTSAQASHVSNILGNSNNLNIPPNVPKIEVKLFVGRLPRTIDENALTPMFSNFGDVTEVVIIRDKGTGAHKGSAFIKMASLTNADSAIRSLHNIQVLDPQLGPIQVKYANGEVERLGLPPDLGSHLSCDIGKLFVGGLPRVTGNEPEIRKVFEPFGRIEEVIVMKDSSTGQPQGCAFVKFALKEVALQAIKALHGKFTFPGCSRPLEVKFAENRKASISSSHPQSTVHSGYRSTTPFRHHSMGVALPQQPSNLNPRSAGGWTEYFTADGRPYYYHEGTNITQWPKPLDFDRLVSTPPGICNASVPGPSDVTGPPGANVFVFHIPNEWNQSDILTHFSQFGRVISCYLATDRTTGRNKGYGFVSYDNIHSAANAVLRMSGFPVGSKRLKVSIKTGEESYVAHLLAPPPASVSGCSVMEPPVLFNGTYNNPVNPNNIYYGTVASSCMGTCRSVPY